MWAVGLGNTRILTDDAQNPPRTTVWDVYGLKKGGLRRNLAPFFACVGEMEISMHQVALLELLTTHTHTVPSTHHGHIYNQQRSDMCESTGGVDCARRFWEKPVLSGPCSQRLVWTRGLDMIMCQPDATQVIRMSWWGVILADQSDCRDSLNTTTI